MQDLKVRIKTPKVFEDFDFNIVDIRLCMYILEFNHYLVGEDNTCSTVITMHECKA